MKQFYEELKKGWSEPDCRIIGHLRSSPGITVDGEGFTEDWSAVELGSSKCKDAFEGTVLFSIFVRFHSRLFSSP